MNIWYYSPPLLLAVIGVPLLIFVLWKGERGPAKRYFSLLLCSYVLWGLVIFAMRRSPDVAHALPWDRAVIPIMCAAFVFYYQFSRTFHTTPIQRFLSLASYGLFAFTIALYPTDLLIRRIEVASYGYAPIVGPMMAFVMPAGYFLYAVAVYNLVQAYRKAGTYEDKNRLLLIIMAMVYPAAGLVVDLLPFAYPAAIFGNIIFAVLTTVALFRYHLLDVHLILNRSAFYVVLSPALLVPVAIASLLLYRLADQVRMGSWELFVGLLALGALFAFVGRWWYDLIAHLFYRKRYDYFRSLEELGRETMVASGVTQVATSLNRLSLRVLGSSHVSCLVALPGSGDLQVMASEGKAPGPIVLSDDNPLARMCRDKKGVVLRAELDSDPRLVMLSAEESRVVHALDAEVYVPITREERLLGLLAIGRRVSGQPYSWEDLKMLSTAASQVAVYLENARLYQLERSRYLALDALQRSTALLASELEPKALLGLVVGQACKLLGALAAGFYVVEENGELRPEAVFSTVPGELGHTVLPAGILSQGSRGHLLLDDITKQCWQPVCSLFDGRVASILLIPMVKGERLLGTLVIYSSNKKKDFGQDDVDLAKTFAHQASIALDIAQRFTAAKERSEELARLDKVRTDFILGISHELRTPLTSVKLAVDLLKEEMGQGGGDRQGRLLALIASGVERLQGRINDLLDLLKMEAGTLKLNLLPVDVRNVIDKAVEFMLPVFQMKNQSFEVEVDHGVTRAELDAPRFEEVVLNLLSNANKYTRTGGRIGLRAREEDGQLVVEIHDNGQGISDDEKESILRFDFRNALTRDGRSGLGVGLTVVKKLVELHNGSFYIDSKVGKGTTVSVRVPLQATDGVEEERVGGVVSSQ